MKKNKYVLRLKMFKRELKREKINKKKSENTMKFTNIATAMALFASSFTWASSLPAEEN